MADVRPFQAIRYAGQLEPLVAPPYDVLSEAELEEYRSHSPHNVVHLTRPGSDYAGAALRLREWLKEGVLVEDAAAAMFVHETQFDGRLRRDLIAALRLQPYGEGAILPHERTHRGPKEDRLALFRATGASLEPLWFLVEGLVSLLAQVPAGEVRTFEFAGERHSLRAVSEPDWVAAVTRALAPRPLLIADGHHRYETALAYADEVGGPVDATSRFTLALLTDLGDPGLVVLPTHRLLKTGVAVTGGDEKPSLGETLTSLRERASAGYYRDGRFQVLPLEGEVPAVELHRQVIDNILGKRSLEENVEYTRDPKEAVQWVDEGRGSAAFFLAEPDLAAVLKLARRGITMPQKTTYFSPKPPSGMVFHRLDPARPI